MKMFVLCVLFFMNSLMCMDKSGYSSEERTSSWRKSISKAKSLKIKVSKKDDNMMSDEELDCETSSSGQSSDSEIVPELDSNAFLKQFFPIKKSENQYFINILQKKIDSLKNDSPEKYARIARRIEVNKGKDKKLLLFYGYKGESEESVSYECALVIKSVIQEIEKEKKSELKKSRNYCWASCSCCALTLLACGSGLVSVLVPVLIHCYS